MFFGRKKKKRGTKQRGGRRKRREDGMKFCPILLLVYFFCLYSRGKNEMLSFPFLWGWEKDHFIFGAGRNIRVPRPLLRWSPLFVSLTSVQDLNFSYFILIYLSYDRFDSFAGKENIRIGSAFVRLLNAQLNRGATKNDKLLTCSSWR